MHQVLQRFGTIYIEGHRRVLEITADILNNVFNCKYGRYYLVMIFPLTFPFTWFSLLILHVLAAVYLKCFSAFSFIVRFCHSLFLKYFCGYSCFDLLEPSEAPRSGWN
jgi:hypothetical protein